MKVSALRLFILPSPTRGSVSVQSVWFGSGKTLYNIEQFGQYPLQVNGFSNLDECLEGAMVEKEIESLHSDHAVTSGREVSGSK